MIDKKQTALKIVKRYWRYWAVKATILIWLTPLTVVIYLHNTGYNDFLMPQASRWMGLLGLTALAGTVLFGCDLIFGTMMDAHMFPGLVNYGKLCRAAVTESVTDIVQENAVHKATQYQPTEGERQVHIWKV